MEWWAEKWAIEGRGENELKRREASALLLHVPWFLLGAKKYHRKPLHREVVFQVVDGAPFTPAFLNESSVSGS